MFDKSPQLTIFIRDHDDTLFYKINPGLVLNIFIIISVPFFFFTAIFPELLLIILIDYFREKIESSVINRENHKHPILNTNISALRTSSVRHAQGTAPATSGLLTIPNYYSNF